ncbi:hypothetical protein ACJZ2D_003878 [Fusarium nematophilum]
MDPAQPDEPRGMDGIDEDTSDRGGPWFARGGRRMPGGVKLSNTCTKPPDGPAATEQSRLESPAPGHNNGGFHPHCKPASYRSEEGGIKPKKGGPRSFNATDRQVDRRTNIPKKRHEAWQARVQGPPHLNPAAAARDPRQLSATRRRPRRNRLRSHRRWRFDIDANKPSNVAPAVAGWAFIPAQAVSSRAHMRNSPFSITGWAVKAVKMRRVWCVVAARAGLSSYRPLCRPCQRSQQRQDQYSSIHRHRLAHREEFSNQMIPAWTCRPPAPV